MMKKVNSDITEHSIRDCLHLGKLNSTRTKLRSLLVKLSQAFDVNTILYNRSIILEGILTNKTWPERAITTKGTLELD